MNGGVVQQCQTDMTLTQTTCLYVHIYFIFIYAFRSPDFLMLFCLRITELADSFRCLQNPHLISILCTMSRFQDALLICAWFGLVIALLMVFLKNALMCILKSQIN